VLCQAALAGYQNGACGHLADGHRCDSAAAAAPILSVCDEEALPCGLVSTNPRNVSFYERLGFRVDAEVATTDGQAIIRPMHRPAMFPD
jgi:hypothetical protein